MHGFYICVRGHNRKLKSCDYKSKPEQDLQTQQIYVKPNLGRKLGSGLHAF